jgi:hypothetical protein
MLELIVRFQITGEFDPAQITSALGVTASETWRKGDVVLNTKMRHRTNGWRLMSGLGSGAGLEEQTKAILKKLEPGWNELQKLCSTLEAELSCVIYTSGYRPTIHFDSAVIQQMASIAGRIDVDLYVMPDDGDQEDYKV